MPLNKKLNQASKCYKNSTSKINDTLFPYTYEIASNYKS